MHTGERDYEGDANSVYGPVAEMATYGGYSCGEVSFDNPSDECEIQEDEYTGPMIVPTNKNATSGASGASGGANNVSSSGASKAGAFGGGENDKDSCECAITVDGPVCSGAKALSVVKEFVADNDISSAGNPVELIDTAKSLTKCETEECALKQIAKSDPDARNVIEQTIRENFKVSGPSDSLDWLDNSNIDNVLTQITAKYTTLYHLPFAMINFVEANAAGKLPTPNMATISMVKDVLGARKDMFCVVINTDKYGNPGIHWFCIFCDFRGGGTTEHPFTIEYFNSSGSRARAEIAEWMIKMERELETARNAAGHNYVVKRVTAAKVQHQIDTDSECGVYSLYYIWRRVKGAPIEEFATRIPDARMTKFRAKLFRNRETAPAN